MIIQHTSITNSVRLL